VTLAPGTTLGAYEILGPLGAGGMGEVYRARDPRLGREVAIKVIPAELAADDDVRRRFEREARAIAALNHPNIVTLHSLEQSGEIRFLTLELVEGETLSGLVTPGGIALERLFDIALPLCAGLEAAHEKGITHRDLKPGNIMLTTGTRSAAVGQLKILDFGLAKPQPEATAHEEGDMTRAGTVMGTTSYMSPEQAAGQPVDHRTDIFSLGVLLYELATGLRPFRGDTAAHVLSSILRDTPTPPSRLADELPAELDKILDRCLAKHREQRYQTVAEVRRDLEALRHGEQDSTTIIVGAAAPEIGTPVRPPETAAAGGSPLHKSTTHSRRPSIAVLPFRASSADPDLLAFATDLMEDIIDGIDRSSEMLVIPASSTLPYKGQEIDVRSTGRDLGARHVLQGTVRRGGQRLRLSVQLADSDSGAQTWSQRYDRDLSDDDLLDIQDDLSAQIVSTVTDFHGVIYEAERQRIEGRPIDSLDPWECIFATTPYDKFLTAEHHLRARAALERAVELDPQFALAWAYLSWVYTDEVVLAHNPRPDSMTRALSAARRGVELNPTSGMARWLLGRVYFFMGEPDRFLIEAEKTYALNSSDGTIVGLLGLYTALSGRWQKGLELLQRAMHLNPAYPGYYHWLFSCDRLRTGEYEAALAEWRRSNMTNGNLIWDGPLCATLGHLGRASEASEILATHHDGIDLATVRSAYELWNFRDELMDELLAGLRKAGLE